MTHTLLLFVVILRRVYVIIGHMRDSDCDHNSYTVHNQELPVESQVEDRFVPVRRHSFHSTEERHWKAPDRGTTLAPWAGTCDACNKMCVYRCAKCVKAFFCSRYQTVSNQYIKA
jgi:hypothetical protein